MSNRRERDGRAPQGRPPRLIAAGFVVAFAASIATIIYTGLLVEGPRRESAASGGAVEAGLPAAPDAEAAARPERAGRAGRVGAVTDGRPADGAAGAASESAASEPGDGAGTGGASGESTP